MASSIQHFKCFSVTGPETLPLSEAIEGATIVGQSLPNPIPDQFQGSEAELLSVVLVDGLNPCDAVGCRYLFDKVNCEIFRIRKVTGSSIIIVPKGGMEPIPTQDLCLVGKNKTITGPFSIKGLDSVQNYAGPDSLPIKIEGTVEVCPGADAGAGAVGGNVTIDLTTLEEKLDTQIAQNEEILECLKT